VDGLAVDGLARLAEPILQQNLTEVGHNMTMQEAKIIVGNRATWEMQAIRKALSMHSWLNTPEENQRLRAVRVLLSNKVKP
jgi:hypothetical protein